MARYTPGHSLSDFLGRVVPKRGAFKSLFFHDVIASIQRLEAVQQYNGWLTISYYNADGIWAYYRGGKAFILTPAQHHIRLVIDKAWPGPGGKELLNGIRAKRTASKASFKETLHGGTIRQWRLRARDLQTFCRLVEGLPAQAEVVNLSGHGHPRTFPTEVRQKAHADFLASGSVCPGVPHFREPHVLSDTDYIEFDHIIPFSKRGASTEANLQVLCVDCNRLKAARVT